MWWWQKVRRADISQDLRDTFENYGETVVAQVIATNAFPQFKTTNAVANNIPAAMEWLIEKRDIAHRREDRVETLEWSILIFIGVEIMIGLFDLAHRV